MMTIHTVKTMKLKDFPFKNSAKITASLLTDEEIEKIEILLKTKQVYTTDSFINDLFSNHENAIARFLGYADFQELWLERYIEKIDLE